jgi:hypothetical protein
VRFGNYRYNVDPTVQTEDIGSDAVECGRLGLLNLDRIGKNILLPSTTKFGEDYTHLDEKRRELLNQRFTELFHIARLIGGVVETDYHAGRGGEVFKPTPAAKQRAAVKFLMTRGVETPGGIFEPAILNRVEPAGVSDELSMLQSMFLATLLSEARVKRLLDNEALNGSSAYRVSELVSDVTGGVWSNLEKARPTSDIYRRSLQRTFLRTVDTRINGASATRTDLKLYLKAALRSLAKKIDIAIPTAADSLTAMHLSECRSDIEKVLNGKYAIPGAGGGSGFGGFFGVTAKDLAAGAEYRCLSKASRIPAEVLQALRDEYGISSNQGK